VATHSAAWTARWLAIHAGRKKGDWATSAAKRILAGEMRKLARGKCAFCESLLEVTSFLEIEHYTAKTVHPERAFEWENLFPICRVCNGSKGEPNAGLDALTRDRVERTCNICKLQRGPLCTKRIEAMNRTIHWLERMAEKGSLDRKLKHSGNTSPVLLPNTNSSFGTFLEFEVYRNWRIMTG
jgi:hypothetical protein